jgi:ABC-2 type transport system ATP-binding protein
MNILDIRGLRKTYENGVVAVDGLTMQVPSGSVFGFIGLNGAGKTTTIRILAGLLAADEGTIQYDGRELRHEDRALKREFAFVLDEPLYFDWMEASAYVEFVGRMYGLERAVAASRAAELMEFLDLAAKAQMPIRLLSTGMKKKVSLAAALIHGPKIIILDEPLEGIDAVAAHDIRSALGLIAQRGGTVLITSHVLDTIERLCTEIAILHEGRKLLQGKTAELATHARELLPGQTFRSLQELFVNLVAGQQAKEPLSWI